MDFVCGNLVEECGVGQGCRSGGGRIVKVGVGVWGVGWGINNWS